MDSELPNALGAFLKESITLLGYQPLGITAAIALVITAVTMWVAAKLLERKERHAGSAIASGFITACAIPGCVASRHSDRTRSGAVSAISWAIRPPMAMPTKSEARNDAYGPLWPKGVIDVQMRRG